MKVDDLNDTFGAVFLGVTISSMLFGVTCLQTWYYYQNYPQDRVIVKLTVATILVLEALHSAFAVHAIYFYLVSNYANPAVLPIPTWSVVGIVGLTDIITLVVHLFYARRVWHVSRKNYILTGLIVTLALTHFGTCTAITFAAHHLGSFLEFAHQAHTLIDASISVAIVCDLLIAASLCYYLHSSRSGWQTTDSLINKLIVYTLHNGILTSIFDILVLLFVTFQQENLVFVAIFVVVGNIYSNAMLATLNARRGMKPRSELSTGPQSSLVFASRQDTILPISNASMHQLSSKTPAAVYIHQSSVAKF